MAKLKTAFGNLGEILKLVSPFVLILGLGQMVVYTWYYAVPFPFSLTNLAIIVSVSLVVGLAVVLAFSLGLLFHFGHGLVDEIEDVIGRLNRKTRNALIAVISVVLVIGALLPVTTSYVLPRTGIGGGLIVIYYLAKDANFPPDLLSGPGSRATKPLYLIIDTGEMVYVRPDQSDRRGILGIRKSQIDAVVQNQQ